MIAHSMFVGGFPALGSGHIFYNPNQKVEKICGIHLTPTLEPGQIRGKVQICETKEITYWGIVVELEGIIKYSDGPTNETTKLFAPKADSPNVMRSTVYCQLAGRPEGLRKGVPRPGCLKILEPHSHIFDFKLNLPTVKTLPASFSSEHVDVTYHIILYKRSRYGYEIMTKTKPIKFYGYNAIPLHSEILPISPPEDLISTTLDLPISVNLQIAKPSFLRHEIIPFTLFVRKQRQIGRISVFLMKSVTVYENSQDTIVDTIVRRKPPNRNEFLIRGAFTRKRETPTYDSPDVLGLKVKYSIKCNIFNRDSEIIASSELDIVIGTTRSVPIPLVEDAAPAPPFRPRRSISFASMLSLFPPAYSNLSLRSGSISSLDTLPPHYDDLVDFNNLSED